MYGTSTYGSAAYGASPSAAPVAPAPDTTAPVMGGTPTVSAVTATGGHVTWPAGTDNVAVVGYEFSCDTGTPIWIDVGNVFSADPAGLSPSTNYTVRIRARDAANNRSNVITAPLATAAAPDSGGGGQTPQVGTIDATKVPAARRVAFEGSKRVVSFEGSIRTVRF